MSTTELSLLQIMRSASVIPVIAIDDPAHAEPLARALVAGGICVLEVTLRTVHGLGRFAPCRKCREPSSALAP